MVSRVSDYELVISNATGCLEVATTIFPYSAWKVPWIHTAFENAAATGSGVEAMYKSLSRQGKINKKMKFVTFGGDGGTDACRTWQAVLLCSARYNNEPLYKRLLMLGAAEPSCQGPSPQASVAQPLRPDHRWRIMRPWLCARTAP